MNIALTIFAKITIKSELFIKMRLKAFETYTLYLSLQQNNFNALSTEQQNKHNFNMKSLNLLSVLVLTLFINSCSDKNDIEDKIIQQTIDAIKITEEEVTLNIGDSHTLTIKHSPEDLPVPEYIWTSSNKDVATINAHGEIKALSIGVTIITAKAKDFGPLSTCQVNVIPIEVTSIKLSENAVKLIAGETHQLSAVIEPDNATYKDIIWTSSDDQIATVYNGNITAVKEGNATITAQLKESKAKASCELTITRKIIKASYNIEIPGSLESILETNKTTITDLTLTGNLDARDLMTLKEMSQLITLDINDTKIHEFKTNDLTFNSDELLERNFENSILEEVKLPKELTVIPAYTFLSCRNLKEVSLPSTVKIIKRFAFNRAINLNTIKLPEGLTRIDFFAFGSTFMKGKLTIPTTVTFTEQGVFQYTSFDEVELSPNLSTISVQFLNYSRNVKKIIIPEGPTKIEANAFGNCESLEYVEIPNSVSEIQSSAFEYCPIVEIHVKRVTPPIIKDSSTLNIKDKSICKIYVPKGSITAYRLSPFWSDFKNFIEE